MADRFTPGATGWVVRFTVDPGNRGRNLAHSWWYGPGHGWGTTSGPLDGSVALFPTKKAAEEAIRSVYGRRRPLQTVERAAEAVKLALSECERRKADVLAGDRPDRAEIAAANDRTAAYLRGEQP